MSEIQEQQEQRQQPQGLPKRVALKEDGYYANCTMVQMTPFDLAILFGKITPVTDGNGQGQLVEMYDRQVYLSPLQARALYEGLGRSLTALMRAAQQAQTQESQPERGSEEDQEKS